MPAADLSKSLQVKVGGIAGLGSSESKSVISLTKSTFAPGEKIKVLIDHDNTGCKKAVKSFKIKLMRKINCLSGKKEAIKPLLTSEEYLVVLKYDGCAEKVRETRTIDFELPNADKKFGSVDMLHPDIRDMVKMFTDSADNTLFTIEYTLQVFVKHQSKLEFGMGNSVEFPIDIKSKSQNIPSVASKEQNWYTAQEITEWAPQVSYPQVHCYFEKNEEGSLIPMITTSDGQNLTQTVQHPIEVP